MQNNILLCVYTTFYLSICSWTFGLFPSFDNVSNAAMNVSVQIICSGYCFHFFCVYIQKWNYWVNGNSGFLFVFDFGVFFSFEALPDCFPKWVHHFALPPKVHTGSSFSTSTPTVVTFCLLDF